MLDRTQTLNQCFLDVRCMALEIAAALDRLDRAAATPQSETDPRLALLRQTIDILASPSAKPDRAQRILYLFSEPKE